ncbi:MAG: recombinase family protein [Lachnospiraceae bacterium]|nr:recombinase family protein [Lachnospiraceae bacterium]
MSKDSFVRAAIYSRKSKYTGVGESIENQIEMCRRYVRLTYGEAAEAECLVFEDEGFSGKDLVRPEFRLMMEAARRKEIQVIVCYRLDRVSRNIADFVRLIEEMDSLGVGFISIKEQFDTASPMGRAMMYISSVFSQLERETIAERIRDNMRELARTGRWLGGNTPTGYESICMKTLSVDGRAKKSCRLKTVEEEKEVVRDMYRFFLYTGSLTETVRHLEDGGFRTRRGLPYSRFTVRGILMNPVYARADRAVLDYLIGRGAVLSSPYKDFDGKRGLMVYNRTLQKKGKAHQYRPVAEWIVSVGDHEGFLSGEDWAAAQKIFQRNRTKGEKREP